MMGGGGRGYMVGGSHPDEGSHPPPPHPPPPIPKFPELIRANCFGNLDRYNKIQSNVYV